MHKFNFHSWRERKQQHFDKEKITLTKAGKTFNVYDRIQENREDTEIYPTLEKYGCIDRMMLDTQGVYADFTAFKDLRDMKEQQEFAKNMFYNLPLETRQQFNNNMHDFVKNGEKWLSDKIKADKEAQEKEHQYNNQVEVQKPTKEEITNG